jgi:Tfp pilus assembly protein PilF
MKAPAAILLLVVAVLSLSACAGVKAVNNALTPREHVTLGELYAAQGHPDLAKQEFVAALRQDQDFPPALVGMGNLAFQAGQMDVAEAHYRHALRLAPQHSGAANNLAMLYLLGGRRLEEAERLARGALERSGVLRPYVLETLASVYLQQGRYREATEAVDEAQKIVAPDSPVLQERLAQLRRHLNLLSPEARAAQI